MLSKHYRVSRLNAGQPLGSNVFTALRFTIDERSCSAGSRTSAMDTIEMTNGFPIKYSLSSGRAPT